MLNFLAKFILTGTSFAPFFIAYSIKEFENGSPLIRIFVFLLIGIGFICICWLMLVYAARKAEVYSDSNSEYTVERREHEGLVFLIVYLLPIIQSESDPFISEPITTIFCLIVIIVAISRSHAFHYNPVMRLFGYRFYTLNKKSNPPVLLISKSGWPEPNKKLKMVSIAEDVFFELGER